MKKQIDVKDNILKKIKAGQIKMKSKTTFILQKLSLKGILSLLIIISILIFSLLIFFFQEQSSSQLLGLGKSGILNFIADLPFSWIIFIAVLIIIATYLFRKSTLAYRKTWKHSFMNLAVIVMLAGTLLSVTGFHQGIAAKAAELDISLLKSVYQRALKCDFDQDHLLIGRIESIDRENKSAQITTKGHLIVTLKLFNDTRIIDTPAVGEIFGAVGYKENDIFYAEGIRKIKLSDLKNRCLIENNL